MRAPHPYYLPLLLVCLTLSCTNPQVKSSAIRDFKPTLQPALITAVGTSIVGYDTGARYIREHATDSELVLLSRCEHPILRAIALREMTVRPSFDHQKIMLQNLDDTATVLVDHGEFGHLLRTVSDQMIEEGLWKTTSDRQTIINEILLHHDNLRSAYTGLRNVDTPEKYYSHLKKMVNRERSYEEEMEYALYALAKCRRKEDIPLIKDKLLIHLPWLSPSSFRLMEEYPDTSYMEVLKKFFKKRFYRSICRDNITSPATSFLNTLGSYKNDSSAAILEAILKRKPFMPCTADTSSLKEALILAVKHNPCPVYSNLKKMIDWKYYNWAILEIDVPFLPPSKDIAREPISWWSTP